MVLLDTRGNTPDGDTRWTATSRSAMGFERDDRKPQTSGDAPPKTSPREILYALARVLAAGFIIYKLTGDN